MLLVIKANGLKTKKDEKKAEIVEIEKVLQCLIEKKEKVGSEGLLALSDVWNYVSDRTKLCLE